MKSENIPGEAQVIEGWADPGRLDRWLDRLAFIPKIGRSMATAIKTAIKAGARALRSNAKSIGKITVDVAGAACLTVAASYLHPAAAWATAGLALLAASWRNR